jgi:hypothetical protein
MLREVQPNRDPLRPPYESQMRCLLVRLSCSAARRLQIGDGTAEYSRDNSEARRVQRIIAANGGVNLRQAAVASPQ